LLAPGLQKTGLHDARNREFVTALNIFQGFTQPLLNTYRENVAANWQYIERIIECCSDGALKYVSCK
jgi:hypothetical protein